MKPLHDGIVTDQLAFNSLRIIAKVLYQDHGILAEMGYFENTPVIQTALGQVIFFRNSGSYRLHKQDGSHSTFSNPMDLIQFFVSKEKRSNPDDGV